MASDNASPPSSDASQRIGLGTTAALPADVIDELTQHGIDVTVIAEDADPPPEIDVVLVLQPPSPLLGRCRGRWPVIVVVDDPRATDVSRLLRAGAVDVVRRPLRSEDVADRVRRVVGKDRDPTVP